MYKTKWYLSFLLLIFVILCGCSMKDSSKENSDNLKEMEKIIIYMNSTPHTFREKNEKGDIVDTVIFPARYTTGTMLSAGDVNSPNANIFEKALEDYSKETGIEIEVHYLEEEYDGQNDMLQEIVDTNGSLPDLLLLNKQPQYDYYRLAEQGYLLDFSDYLTDDEEVQNEELYYQEVLAGGKINSKQYALPLLFSMNAMMTSSSYLVKIGCPIPEYGVSYEELMYILEDSCVEMTDNDTIAAIHETSGSMLLGHYIPSILTSAAYPNYFDESTGQIVVTEEVISGIFELMKYYNRQEFVPILGWEENSYIENIQFGKSKSYQIPFAADVNSYIGIFLSGGRSGGLGFYSSLLTDVAFMQTVYEDDEEEMVLCGIPTVNSEWSYSANISMAAYGMATTEYPEEVYNLVRYLMDYEFPYQYGFSVNKEITSKQIENAQKTTISVYPENIWDGVNSVMSKEKLQDNVFHTDPLSAENAAIIENMLDNIEGAGIPYAVLEYNMYNSMLNMVGDNKMTPDEAGEWVITQWNQYLDQMHELEPFYDVNFNNSIQLYGDLPEE